jgi:two-component system, OmpR family, sensor histidine kinase KdpD
MPNENEPIAESAGPGPVVLALGPAPGGEELVEAAAAIAASKGAALECLTVGTGAELSPEDEERLAGYQDLARGRGALIVRELGADAASAVLRYASRRRASAIVVGRGRRRRFAGDWAERLRRADARIALIEIAGRDLRPGGGARVAFASLRGGSAPPPQIAAAALAVSAVTAINLVLAGYVGYWAAAIPYLALVSLSALLLEWPAVLAAALLSAVAWDFFFIPPRFALEISRVEDAAMLALYFVVAVGSGLATAKLRASSRIVADSEARLSRLGALAIHLTGEGGAGAARAQGRLAIRDALELRAIAILGDGRGGLRPEAESGWEPLDAGAVAAARLCFDEGRIAGRFTDAFPDCEWQFLPLERPGGRLGVVGVRPAHVREWDEGEEAYLKAAVAIMALALARSGIESAPPPSPPPALPSY